MRRNVWRLPALIVAVAAVGAPRAWAQAPTDTPQPHPNSNPAAAVAPGPGPVPAGGQVQPAPVESQKLADLLALWEKNSTRLKTLDVALTRTDKSPAWDEDERYQGRALLKSPNRAFLNFEKEVEVVDPKTGKKTRTVRPHERIVCTGNEVWQYRCETRQIFIYPLEKDVQQRALEEGPLPFLFNFQAAAAQKRYKMALVDETEDFDVIQIIPRLEIDRESFTKAWVKLDRKFYLLPSRIFLLSPDGKSSKDFELKYTKESPNKRVMDANFEGKALPGWKVIRNPANGARPAPAARVAQPAPAEAGAGAGASTRTVAPSPAPAPQPAMRPRLFGGRRN